MYFKILSLDIEFVCEDACNRDWQKYVNYRILLLHNMAHEIIGRMLGIQNIASVGVPLKDKHGVLHRLNFSALESMLFLFPHIFWELAMLKLFGVDETGKNLALDVSGCI